MKAEVEVPPPPSLLSGRSLIREFHDHLPIWFVYLSAIGLLHAAFANFPDQGFHDVGIARQQFVATTPFPLIWFTAYFVLRIRRSRRIQNPWKAYLALAGAVVGVPLLIIFGYRSHPLSHEQLTILFELTQFTWVALFVAQIALTRGWPALLMFFGVTFVYGLMLENTGIVMHFFYEPSFHTYLGFLPAPLCTMLGWSLVFYIVISITEQLAQWVPWLAKPGAVWRRVAVASALALSLDAQLDPLASMSGVFWRWNELLPQAFFGVPAINFAAWFGAIAAFSFFVFRIRDRDDWNPYRQNWELFLRVPLACAVAGGICFAIMTVVEGGFHGPSFQILRAFGHRLLPY